MKERPHKYIESAAEQIAQCNLVQFKNAANLLDDGKTVPFIARYRREKTHNLDESQLRDIEKALKRIDNLEAEREKVQKSLKNKGISSPQLVEAIENADSIKALEDLYAPYKQSRATRASKAHELGLCELAETITVGGRGHHLKTLAQSFVKSPGVPTIDAALAGARDIIAEWVSNLTYSRQYARSSAWKYSALISKKKTVKNKENSHTERKEADVYSLYHQFRKAVSDMRPHQVLAINRGEREGVLSVGIDWRLDPIAARCHRLFLKSGPPTLTGKYLETSLSEEFAAQVRSAVEDGVKRLLARAIEREVRVELTKMGAEAAVSSFSRNVYHLLLQPPLPGVVVLGVDPGYRTGCKLCVCDATGKVVHSSVILLNNLRKEQLLKILAEYRVQAIAIGNGTASRETQKIISEIIKGSHVGWCVISEAGASVYSASELARKELPELDVTLRGAASIARRLQDPLSELVKVEPASLGVGEYQHDIKESILTGELNKVVETAVNKVGVDVNSASSALLEHVSGLNRAVAAAIVAHRDSTGPFSSRKELLNVKGLGPFAFEQCAGFLRIRNANNPLDATIIHPESYNVVENVLRSLVHNEGQPHSKKAKLSMDCAIKSAVPTLKKLLDNPKEIESKAQELGVGIYTLTDILQALSEPLQDVRGLASLKDLQFGQALSIEQLHSGMKVKGIVRNVVDFGAFVDINAGDDGLIHISTFPKREMKLLIGDVVQVEILAVDISRKRISLILLH